MLVGEDPRFPLGKRGARPLRLRIDPSAARRVRDLLPGSVYSGGYLTFSWEALPAARAVFGDVGQFEFSEPVVALPGLEEYRRCFATKLRGYQKVMLQFLVLRAYAINADPMRSGKTPTTLAAASIIGSEKTLIVCPAIAKLVWCTEIVKWLGLPSLLLYGRAGDEAREFCVACNGSGRDSLGKHCPVCKTKNGQSFGTIVHSTREGVIEMLNKHRFIIANYDVLTPQMQRSDAGVRSERVDLPGWHELLTNKGFDLCIIDECFVAGTKVLTPRGSVRIEYVRCGDMVHTATGLGRVEAVICKPAITTLRMEFDDGSVTECTPDHPFLTREGWRKAETLEVGTLTVGHQGLRTMWEDIWSVTRDHLRGVGLGRDCLRAADLLLKILLQEAEESDEQAPDTTQSSCGAEAASSSADSAWRERAAAAVASASAASRAGRGMGSRACGEDRQAAGISAFLQPRHRERGADDLRGGRRGESRNVREERAGQKEDGVSGFSRLVRVSRVERASAVPVFNLHVSGHPSYFADGKLVHNCHILRGRSKRDRVGESRRDKLISICNSIERVWGLTGTPIFGRVADLWAMLDVITNGLYGRPFFSFDVHYCNGHKGEYGWVNDGMTNPEQLKSRLDSFLLKRDRKEILPELPPKTRQIIRIDAGKSSFKPPKSGGSGGIHGALRVTAAIKEPYVVEAVANECAENAKVVVYTHGVEHAQLLAQAIADASQKDPRLKLRNMRVWCITGAVSTEARFKQAQAFREWVGAAAFVATIESVPVAISLKGAQSVHFADMTFDPASLLQAEDRPYEVGITNGLAIVYYVVEKTIDEHVVEIVMPKMEMLENVMAESAATDFKGAFGSQLTPEQMAEEIWTRMEAAAT